MNDKIKNSEAPDDFEEFDEFDGSLIENDEFPEIMEENFNDDVEFSDDENIDNFDEFDEIDYSKPNPPNNGVNWFNIGVIGAVIIGIAGLTYSFLPSIMGGNTSPAKGPVIAVKTAEENKKIATDIVSNGATENNEVSFFNNPDLLNNNPNQPDTNEIPAEDNIFNAIENPTPSISDDEIDDLFAAIPEAQTNIPSAPQDDILTKIDTLPMPSDANPVTVDGSVDDILNFEPDIIESAKEPQLTQTMATPSQEIEQINTRIDSMNTQMESFMNRLESRLENISVPTSQTVTVDNSDQINALQQSISQLESRLNAMAEQPKPQIEIAPSPAPVVTIAEEPKPKVMIEKKAPDVLLPTPSPTKTVSAPKRREPAYVPPKMTYDLRGASNGQAVIAQKGTQNLQTVSVGMVVRGLGTIRSIAVENGQWVVRGTNGTVRQ